MKTALFAALLIATPALAQPHGATDPAGGGNMREPNLANPQAQTNQGMQPPNAHQNEQDGQATSIPTPTLNQPMTPTR